MQCQHVGRDMQPDLISIRPCFWKHLLEVNSTIVHVYADIHISMWMSAQLFSTTVLNNWHKPPT